MSHALAVAGGSTGDIRASSALAVDTKKAAAKESTPMTKDYEIAPETIQIGLLCGLMTYNEKDDVYELTAKGDKYLKEWCAEQISIARIMAI